MVPGPVFVETKSRYWNCEKEKILALGYPRYDWMLHPSVSRGEALEKLFSIRYENSDLDAYFPKK